MAESLAKRDGDILSIAGIAALVYLTSVLLHEAGGHGGACVALGLHPVEWGAYYFDCQTKQAPLWQARVVAAAGSSVNLVVAILSALLLKARLARPQNPGSIAVALWLMFMVNALTWAGYFLFSGVANIGDWSTGPESVLAGVPAPILTRAVMALTGGLLYVGAMKLGGQFLSQLVGGARRDLARRLVITAYVTGGASAVVIGFLNPIGWFIVLASAAASTLGGTQGLLYTPRFMPADPAETGFALPRQWGWILAGLAFAGLYAAVLGRSIHFG